jgi:hypothetical protein
MIVEKWPESSWAQKSQQQLANYGTEAAAN